MIRRPPRSTRTDTLFPYTTLFRSGIDVMAGKVPVAVPIACPVVGGTVRSVDDARARAFPGVRQIVVLDDLVAVVADHTWVAIKGASLLDIVWDEGPNAALGSAEIWGALRRDSRSEEHTSELQSLMRNSYAVFRLKKKKT